MKNDDICISILMPVYNTALYLSEAIDSILNQTFENFELILLDDFSSDDSSAIIDNYSLLDKRVIVYHGKENVGLANILNVGIKMARGRYIARMDSDDVSLSDRLQIQFEFLESRRDIDLCSCAMMQFGASNRLMKYDNDTEAIKFNAMFYSPVLHASSMWRKDRFDGLFFEQDFVPAEDYRLWTKALALGVTMANIPDVLYLYRIHADQATQQSQRLFLATEKVRTEYVKMMFPTISDQDLDILLNIPFCVNMDHLYLSLQLWQRLNEQTTFVSPSYLKTRLKRYYQSRLYADMSQNGIIWPKLFLLRLVQIVKLFVNKKH